MSGVLLVSATAAELRGRSGLVCGVGPVEAAASVAATLATDRPTAVLHVGIAGSLASTIEVGSVVVGGRAIYEDRDGDVLAPRIVDADARLVGAVSDALGVATVDIGTTAKVGGGRECPVEAMEGFAVLRACELAGVPAVELRAISNAVDDARADWRIAEALAALDAAIPLALEAIAQVL